MVGQEKSKLKTDLGSHQKKNRKKQILFGGFLIITALLVFLAFTSYLFSWKEDFSTIGQLSDRNTSTQNVLNKLGASISHFFIYRLFGLSAYLLNYLFLITGITFFLNRNPKKLLIKWSRGILHILWFSIALAFFYEWNPLLGGLVGFEMHDFFVDYIGKVGLASLLFFLMICFFVIEVGWTPESFIVLFKKNKKQKADGTEAAVEQSLNPIKTSPKKESSSSNTRFDEEESSIDMEIQAAKEEDTVKVSSRQSQIEKQDFYDPTLELSKFRLPQIDFLKSYGNNTITINQEELEVNKNTIVETLRNYKIDIASIKATIGPTVTLYEIVPEAGIRISKIKNLEDDIALSLSALGIRIIAPIPGKGTIGIEVPNQNPSIVSMRSVISAARFQNAEMELPLALGKTISNETFVVDLAKMPHLLMAGATGQGKSVGLNAILTSLLYKKHPAEVKLVLVDPKKVELTIYNKIERHYLAKLPDTEEAIITDNSKVINTLNSLCIEMDNRYELLKNGLCRNIKEYNEKFRSRKLNPNEGHTFLPYIVLVVDEFADLIMTAGKEVETPIARLAQLARAVGIHLIIATQRPSVNVITGIIKANFPARIAFRVTSKIDSRTILDGPGADQLIGRGDMLYTQGNDLIRIQCAFVDTPEVDKIAGFVGAQTGYADAHLLPEYVGEESDSALDIDPDERDSLFKEAAEVIVIAQQGSTSLLQRKLKLGYNRAGRIIDQMEAAGIVGPFEGSKARQVLISDLKALEELLNNK